MCDNSSFAVQRPPPRRVSAARRQQGLAKLAHLLQSVVRPLANLSGFTGDSE